MKPDGVGDDDLALVREPQPPADRIERREQLVSAATRVAPVIAFSSVDLPAFV